MKLSGFLKSFRWRIVLFNTAGMLVLVLAWIYGDQKILLNALTSEAEAKLRVIAYDDISRIRKFFRESERPRLNRLEEFNENLLLILDQEGEILFESSQLAGMPMDDLYRITNDLSMRSPNLNRGNTTPASNRNLREYNRLPAAPFRVDKAGEKWVCQPADAFSYRFLYGMSLAPTYERSRSILGQMLMVVPVFFLITLLINWFVAHQSLRPVRRLSKLAEEMDVDHMNKRLSSEIAPSEFRRLLDVFNEMMGRLEKSFKQSRQFSADASHELKTPLTILQGKLEQEIETEESGSQRQRRVSSLLDEVMHLKHIIDKLMLLNLGDSGQLRLEKEKLDIFDVIREIVEDFNEEDHSFDLEASLCPSLVVKGDLSMLRKVFQNLYENAFKYNRPGGKVCTRIRADRNNIIIDIGNHGKGIPEELQPHVFDRFFRAIPSRSRRIEGTGLGLSIVKEILRWHKGSISLLVSKEDWTEFRIQLPCL